MAYVTVPKDLTRVKSKIVFGLTKRQLICFGGALLVGVPLYFLLRGRVTGSAAALIMVFAMLPGLLLALYERHGQPLEVVVWQIVQCCFIPVSYTHLDVYKRQMVHRSHLWTLWSARNGKPNTNYQGAADRPRLSHT